MPPKPGSTKVRKKPNKPRDVPFPSPTGSDGPPVPPPRPDLPRAISELVHSGLPGFNIDPLPIGFPAEYNMCYRNAALSLLVNVAPFVGYLDQFSLQTRNTNENVLIELGDMATAYWSQDSEEQRRERLRPIIDKLWAHLLCLNYDNRAGTVGWGPFLDSTQREMQQDAGDFLENLLVNADGECDQGRKDRFEYSAVVETTFQVRTACAGNCEESRTRREQLDRTRMWSVDMDHAQGSTGGTLQDAIQMTLKNELDLTCKECKKLRKGGKLGRIWLRMRDTPEVLFMRISRFERTKKGRLYRKCNNEVIVPEILDVTPYLAEFDKQAGVEARYRLCGAINHAGTMDHGHFVSHVRGQSRQWYRLDDETVTESSIATLNNDPAKFGKHKFTPYILAYTKIFDDDLSPDPALQQPTPPATPAKSSSKDARFRVKVNLADQAFTMTRKLKGFETVETQDLQMQMDIVDANGDRVLKVDPITAQLVKALEATSSRASCPKSAPLKTPRKPLPKTGLATPSPTPTKETATSRSKREEKAKVQIVKSL